MTGKGAMTGFLCESKLLSDIMLRINLAVSGQGFEQVNDLSKKFWEDEKGAQTVIELISAAEEKYGAKKHAAIFGVLLRLLAKEYLRSMGYENEELAEKLKFITEIVPKEHVAFELGGTMDHPEGPVRGKF